ncbi:hypothetical protein CK203_030005 [Vitis vinifera]|uniref:Endonuclease/exonuclease/phosphatase domain-containing protein n=1 Tax=Vitis vinifera TaxID=29760 RepID=A0A438IKA8_VITVI|nr:hypothetical protein CK203_030005 [Vitis vinifera]
MDHLSHPASREKGLNFEGYLLNDGNGNSRVPQLSRLNLLSESCNYVKTNPSSHHGAPILGIASQGDTEFSQTGGFQIEGLSSSKMAKSSSCWMDVDLCGYPLFMAKQSLTRKDFLVELSDLFGLTFPSWCVGGDFNVIRRSSEKLGGSRSLLA